MGRISSEALVEAILSGGRVEVKKSETEVVELLQASAHRYTRENPFRVHDLVTPYSESYVRGRGEPHVVIQVRPVENSQETGIGDPALPNYGARRDLRIIAYSSAGEGQVVPYWIESSQFDFWIPKKD